MTNIIATAYKLAYQITPIMLRQGIAPLTTGGFLPIVALTQVASSAIDLVNGKFDLTDLDSYFAQWEPLAGTQLENWQIGQYPFANQATAANAMIRQPLAISMLMKCPVRGKGGYAARIASMAIIKLALDEHIQRGGWFDVATPSWTYTGCLLTSMTDVTSSAGHQKQIEWRLDFQQPLITSSQLQQVLNSSMSKVSSGLPQ